MFDVATNNTPGGAPKPIPSRRSFLARALGASALAVPALGLVSAPRAGAAPPSNKKLTGLTADLLQEIMNDEASHVTIIQHLLNDPDNPLPVPIRKPPHFNLAALTRPTL